jgi:predicted Zn-dependent protease
MGKIPEAEAHAQKAEALQPSMAPVHILLGNIALRKQDAASALKEFQEYLRLDPKGPMAQGAEAMVNKIQSAMNPKQ